MSNQQLGLRAVRPEYVAVSALLNGDSARENMLERERRLAIEAILSQAATLGVAKALETYGDPLLPTEHKLLASLTKQDVEDLQRLRAKLGALWFSQGVTVNVHKG